MSLKEAAHQQGTPWKIAIATLLVIFLAGMASSMLLAAKRGSRVVDHDYYSHGLHYGKTASGAANDGLGWQISASLAGSDLKVQVTDRAGAPVSGGQLRFQPEAGRAESVQLALAEQAPGLFRAPRPASKGELRGTLLFSRGEAAASQRLVLFN